MEITINIQQDSKIFAQFSATHSLEAPASIQAIIVVDNAYNSTKYSCTVGPPGAGIQFHNGHIEFLTTSLDAGLHTITIQFLRQSGEPTILDRTLTVMEIISQ